MVQPKETDGCRWGTCRRCGYLPGIKKKSLVNALPYKTNPGKPPKRGSPEYKKWQQAAEKFKAFHWGDEPEGLKEVRISKPPKFGFAIGEVVSVAYETTKNGEKAVWEHEFGEEGGKRPTLVADAEGHRLHFVGGDYTVEARGIVD